MRILVHTPTCRPGIDVSVESIRRQEVEGEHELTWLVGDDLYDTRWDMWDDLRIPGWEIETFIPKEHSTRKFAAVAANDHALRLARAREVDLYVQLADYTWAPPNGIQRFIEQAALHPGSLLTGIAHISSDPTADKIVNPGGDYTIFGQPYTGKPETVDWTDCRCDWEEVHWRQCQVDPQWWEFNWAAITHDALMDDRVNFDLEFDNGHGHDNSDFSITASEHGHEIWLDYDNVSVRLPRRAYFPVEDAAFVVDNNRGLYERKSLPRMSRSIEEFDDPWNLPGRFTHLGAHTLPDLSILKYWRSRVTPGGKLHVVCEGDRNDLAVELALAGFARAQVLELPDGRLECIGRVPL